eukprot:TRINITY_DN89295_c0_g1_i1.p5 TRINITY_DN89295_c0_g1~~TRINITY_DN89295_c0_g1_i1.p5  ORF type:complete len:200 (+),score=28.67 TRINITY_DN89295_c0_g1_i1:608-1207(+)
MQQAQLFTDKVRLFPPDIPAGDSEIPPLMALAEQQKKWEEDLEKAKVRLNKLEAEMKIKIKEDDKLVNDKQLAELQLQLQELRDTMIEYTLFCLQKRRNDNLFEEKAKHQLKAISSNEMAKYEPTIETCTKLFEETKKLIANIENMWRGVTEISQAGGNVKAKSEATNVLNPNYIKQFQSYQSYILACRILISVLKILL